MDLCDRKLARRTDADDQRDGRDKEQLAKHVEAGSEASRDAGSIPAASIGHKANRE